MAEVCCRKCCWMQRGHACSYEGKCPFFIFRFPFPSFPISVVSYFPFLCSSFFGFTSFPGKIPAYELCTWNATNTMNTPWILLGVLLGGDPRRRSQPCCSRWKSNICCLARIAWALQTVEWSNVQGSSKYSTEIYLFTIGRSTNTYLWPTNDRTEYFCSS